MSIPNMISTVRLAASKPCNAQMAEIATSHISEPIKMIAPDAASTAEKIGSFREAEFAASGGSAACSSVRSDMADDPGAHDAERGRHQMSIRSTGIKTADWLH